MYKLLLCWRYLRTRYIALASVVSVMLGVATLIVVNAVMAGFRKEMEDRIHGVLADLSLESRSLDGMPDADWHMEQIRKVAGDQIEAMTPTVVVPGMMFFCCRGNWITREVIVIGIDADTQADVSALARYLNHPENRRKLSFELREGGYDLRDHQAGPEAPLRPQMAEAGWPHRRRTAAAQALEQRLMRMEMQLRSGGSGQPDHSDQAPLPRPTSAEANLGEAAQSAVGQVDHRVPASGFDDHRAAERLSGPASTVPGQIGPASTVPGQADPASTVPGQAGPAGTIPGRAGPAGATPGQDLDGARQTGNGFGENRGTVGHLGGTLGPPVASGTSPSPAATAPPVEDPFARRGDDDSRHGTVFDPAKQQHTGAIVGIGLISYRDAKGEDQFLCLPGDDVKLVIPNVAMPPQAISDEFTIVDLYESKMSEYDAKFVFVPIRRLQQLRGMIDPTTGVGMVNSIQIKLKPGADPVQVRDKLRAAFSPVLYHVSTWRDKQNALLAAVQMETAILNVLLFLIIAVAGFGILAIFFMIVVEKTRDIGILKALGAPAGGVMGIFLSYGLSLGLVGSGVGLVLGLLLVRYINQIADFLGWLTGRPVFDPQVYYFYTIPAIVHPWTVCWIVAGAILIAISASILPAWRAARLHPVEALRYE